MFSLDFFLHAARRFLAAGGGKNDVFGWSCCKPLISHSLFCAIRYRQSGPLLCRYQAGPAGLSRQGPPGASAGEESRGRIRGPGRGRNRCIDHVGPAGGFRLVAGRHYRTGRLYRRGRSAGPGRGAERMRGPGRSARRRGGADRRGRPVFFGQDRPRRPPCADSALWHFGDRPCPPVGTPRRGVPFEGQGVSQFGHSCPAGTVSPIGDCGRPGTDPCGTSGTPLWHVGDTDPVLRDGRGPSKTGETSVPFKKKIPPVGADSDAPDGSRRIFPAGPAALAEGFPRLADRPCRWDKKTARTTRRGLRDPCRASAAVAGSEGALRPPSARRHGWGAVVPADSVRDRLHGCYMRGPAAWEGFRARPTHRSPWSYVSRGMACRRRRGEPSIGGAAPWQALVRPRGGEGCSA